VEKKAEMVCPKAEIVPEGEGAEMECADVRKGRTGLRATEEEECADVRKGRKEWCRGSEPP